MNANTFPARITVLSPCRCSICERKGSRWFQCPTADLRVIKAYEGPGVEDGPFPTQEFISDVRALHPEADLVYIG